MDEVDRRLEQLENSNRRMAHTLFGNGEVGMDERLRHVEEAQERNEAARVADRTANDRAIAKVDSRLSNMEAALAESVGSWRVARWAAGFGIPAIIAFLGYIARQVS